MRMLRWAVLILPIALAALVVTGRQRTQVHVGSKTFTESVVLGEVLTQLASNAGAGVAHIAQLGGTSILFEALVNGEIDMYVEYTGTIREEILAGRSLPDNDSIEAILADSGVRMSAPLGFNNTYAIGMLRPVAERFAVTRVSDLRARPSLRLAFSNESSLKKPSMRRRDNLLGGQGGRRLGSRSNQAGLGIARSWIEPTAPPYDRAQKKAAVGRDAATPAASSNWTRPQRAPR